MFFRTDLALESRKAISTQLDGVAMTTRDEQGLHITRMEVQSEQAAKALEKQQGTYITVELPSFTDDCRHVEQRALIIAQELASLLPTEKGLVLVAGLGNHEITPDSLGPRMADCVLATRHIMGEIARSAGLDELNPVAVLSPGVLGQTGIETEEFLHALVEFTHPACVIVVDALASRSLSRLGCTVQLSNTGISPGAGVKNARPRIAQETLGVPVISIGVPTVVDAVTLASDLLACEDDQMAQQVKAQVSPRGAAMVVTPREIDLLVERASKLVGLAINCALQPSFTAEDLLSLVN